VIEVTSASGGAGVGTFRWAYDQIRGPSKIVLSATLDEQNIVFPDGFLLKADKPYVTIDCSQTSARFETANEQAGSQGFVVGSTHDVIVYGCGGVGHFNEAAPQVPGNNMSIISIAGSFVPVSYPWDDQPPNVAARNILFDRVGCAFAQDDCLAVFEGAKDVSILRFFNRRGFHPMTWGAAAPHPRSDSKARLRIAMAYGATYRLGARTPRLYRGVFDFQIMYNIFNWFPWVSPAGPIQSGAVHFEDDDPGMIDNGVIMGNLGIPPEGEFKRSGAYYGNWYGCEGNGPYPDPSNITVCNSKLAGGHWYVAGNDWGALSEVTTWPSGYTLPGGGPIYLPRTSAQVLAEVGPIKRLPAEQADLDALAFAILR
jgi:hypothetical protein